MDYKEILKTYHDDMLKTLGESVSFRSCQSEAVRTSEGEVLPFGRGVHDAFVHMLGTGADMGFRTFNADNYGGHIEFRSEEENAGTLGIVAHLDVVPEGTGWTEDAYTMTEKDGYVYGRGVSDDKGPLVASLYAMKALKESGFKPNKNIRLILGLDEEVGKEGMFYYLDKAGQPDMGFTPDGHFPLVNGEMGIIFLDIAQRLSRLTDKDGLRLTKFEAGTAGNAVPGTAKAVVIGDAELYNLIRDRLAQYVIETGYNIKAKKQGASYVIEATGIAAHGASPEKGLNAISILMDFLGRLQFLNEEVNDFIAFYNEHIGFDLHGERLGCDISDEPSGRLILNVGVANINEDIAQLTLNIRYPVTCTEEQVYEGIEKTLANSNMGIIKTMHEGPIYKSLDDPMVEKLMEAYREETGDENAEPFIMAGGTYAKLVENTLAFGALFPDEEDSMHQADEKMSIDSFFKMADIYANAVYKLCSE